MFIHIGNKKIISDKKIIGIFNCETVKLSNENIWYYKFITADDKTIVIAIDNSVITSKVSPFTVIQRTTLEDDFIWRKENE